MIKRILTLIPLLISLHAFAGQYGNKLFSCAKTLVTAGAVGYIGAELREHVLITSRIEKHNSLDEASPAVRDFVHEIMKREGIENPKEINVYIDPYTFLVSTCELKSLRSIYLGTFYAESITHSIELQNIANEDDRTRNMYNCYIPDYLARHRAFLTHEAAHLKYNHPKKRPAFQIFFLYLYIYTPYPTIPKLQTHFPKTASLIRLSLPGMCAGMYYLLAQKICRIQEFEADDAITRPEEIEAAFEYFNRVRDKAPGTPSETVSQYITELTETHPSDSERADRFAHRLQKLHKRIQE